MAYTDLSSFGNYCHAGYCSSNISGSYLYLPIDMKKTVKKVNRFFISIVLIIFYFVFIGISNLLLRLFSLASKKEKQDTYWKKFKQEKFDSDYFKSAY